MSEGTSLIELHKKFPYLDGMEKRADEYDAMTEEEKGHVDSTDGYDFLPFTQYWEEVFYCLGNDYKPRKDCHMCDSYEKDPYVCFEHRWMTLTFDHNKWEFKYYEN